nr:hypothetical protein [Tanacetum cinerariifolium]
MDTIIDQQVAMDEALVPTAQQLRIGSSNFCLLSDIKSKESTLQLVYDVLRICPFFKAFLVTAMDTLHICPRVHGQSFAEPPFKEEILAFICFLGHSTAIKTLIDVNINKLYQSWRSFAAIINKCLTGKSSGHDSLRLSQAQILWGLYHKRNTIATGEAAPKPKASVRRTRSSSDTSITPPTAAASLRLIASAKGKQTTKASKAKSLSALSEVAMTKAQQLKLVTKRSMQQTHISQPSGSDSEDEGDGEEHLSLNVGEEERHVEEEEEEEEEEEDELYRDVNINQGRGIQATLEVKDSHVTLTPVNLDGQQESSSASSKFTPTSVAPLLMTASTMTPSTISTITTPCQAPIPPTTVLSNIIQNLPNFGSLFRFDDRLRSLEANFSEAMHTNQFAGAVSAIPKIVHQYIEQQMNEAVKVAVQIQTSYAVAADLSEMELKKILIEKMDDEMMMLIRMKNPPLDQTGGQRDAASAPTETATRSAGRSIQGSRSRQASASESALAEEPMQTTSQMEEPSHPEFDTGANDQPIVQSSQHPEWFSQQQKPPSLDRDWNKTVPAVHRSIQPWISELAKQADTRSSFNELIDTPLDFSNFIINQLKVDTLTTELLAGQQYLHNLLKPLPLIPNNRGCRVIPFENFINNNLEYLRGGASSRKYTTSITKTKAADYGHIKWIEDLVPRTIWIEEPIGYDKHALWGVSHWGRKRQQFYGFAVNWDSSHDVYSKRRIITNKDKRNRLMRIDKLHKFSDGTLTDVRTALDDRLKGIQMQYLPQSIWRKSDKDRAAAMIQDIDKRLKTKRIVKSLDGWLEEGCTRETSGCYKGPYDLSYVAPIFQEVKLVQFYLVNM